MLAHRGFDFLQFHLFAAAKDEQALNQILELTDIPMPGIVSQEILNGHGEASERQLLATDEIIDVKLEKVGNVLAMLMQRGHFQCHDVQQIVEL